MRQRNILVRFFHDLLLAWAALALLLPAFSAQALALQPKRNAITSSLVPETSQAVPGETIALALTMTPEPGWHGYWQNPGDAGAGAKITWDLPQGVTVGPIQYPVPGRMLISGLMNYVYEAQYTALIDLTLSTTVAPGTRLLIRGEMEYLACTDKICVPEHAVIATELVAVSRQAQPDRSDAFDRFRAKLPKPIGGEGSFENEGGRLRLAIPLPASYALSDPYFFPLTEGAIEYSAPQNITRSGDFLILETKASAKVAELAAIEGVLAVGPDQGLFLRAVRGDVPAAGIPIVEGGIGLAALLAALAGAMLGGLLLNIMPCVFPILSLKALSLASAGGDEGKARREALAYTAGATLMCLMLGAALLAVRAGGAMVGWAFQLQDPHIILFLLLLISGIALNLAGLFELPALAAGGRLVKAGGSAGAFWTGALAAFVATPCTGPFMGAALGAALVLPTPAALAVFAGLGLGLALPFLLIGFVPALRRKLPKPGPWMVRLRHILSVPMFITAFGLAWILGRQTGVDGMAFGLGAALFLGLCLWWLGRRQGAGSIWLPVVIAGATVFAAILYVPAANDAPVARSQGALPSEPFSEERLAMLRAEGRPVFVYFTADWCLTCKVNEKGALERRDVIDSFARKNIAILVGDWTKGDAAIGRFLAKHGRSGVPLYLYYAPGKDAEVLPQILTVGRLARLS